MQQSFAQISDPHLTTLDSVRGSELWNKRALSYLSWRRKRRFEHRREVLDALQRDLAGLELQQLLVTGDLTHVGAPDEFRQAAQWLRQLGEPADISVIPGNHDSLVNAPWQQTYALWQDYLAGDEPPADAQHPYPSLRVRGDVAFIGLSSGCPKPPLLATGTVSQEELAALPALLQSTATRGLFRVVCVHHSPIPGFEKWRKRLTNAEALSELLRDYGAELVLHGHGHRAHYNELETRAGTLPVISVPSASALGLHGADVAGYNRYTVARISGGWELEVATRQYARDTGEFDAGASRTVELARQ
ncbi:MAG: metallophosphoesterase family protein [Halioglobus sp.]